MKINPAMQSYLSQSQSIHNTDTNKAGGFGDVLQKELNKVNTLQVQADKANQEFVIGESEDMHSVLLATEEARLSLELAVQIRNKIIESYQEISRMQL